MMDEIRQRLRDHMESTTYRALSEECGLNIRTLHQIVHGEIHPRFDDRFVKLLEILGWVIVDQC